MTIIFGHCTKCGQPAGTCQCDSTDATGRQNRVITHRFQPCVDGGELWSFLRAALSQGGAIWQDNKDKCFEEYSAHLDYAARELTTKLIKLLNATRKP